MKRFAGLLTILFVFAGVVLSAQDTKSPDEDAKGPALRFDCGSTYDWGTVKYKESPLKCAVRIYNDGTENLKINKVKPGCGCTKTSLDKDDIPPGDSATIELKLHLKNHPGKTAKSVAFYTNDPKREKHILFLKAFVETGYTVTPTRFRFYNATVGKPITSKLLLENSSDEDLKIGDLKIRPDDLKVSGIAKGTVIPKGETVAIEATYTPDKEGRISAYVTITAENHPDIGTIRIYGSGQASPAEEEKAE